MEPAQGSKLVAKLFANGLVFAEVMFEHFTCVGHYLFVIVIGTTVIRYTTL